MKVYFDVMKLIFFLLTIFVAIFQLRLKMAFSISFLDNVGPYILPVYFVFLGLMVGYIIGYMMAVSHDNTQDEKDYLLGFIIGAVIGVVFAFIFYSFSNV